MYSAKYDAMRVWIGNHLNIFNKIILKMLMRP